MDSKGDKETQADAVLGDWCEPSRRKTLFSLRCLNQISWELMESLGKKTHHHHFDLLCKMV